VFFDLPHATLCIYHIWYVKGGGLATHNRDRKKPRGPSLPLDLMLMLMLDLNRLGVSIRSSHGFIRRQGRRQLSPGV
jgi:hypothetical protein